MATAQDRDPSTTSPKFDVAALAVSFVRCLVAEDIEAARAKLTEEARAVLTPEVLRRAWNEAVEQCDALTVAVQSSHQARRGTLVKVLASDATNREVHIDVPISLDGRVAGVRFFGPGDD